MKYAVIKTGGKQYKVSEGDVLEVDKIEADKDNKIEFEEVLLKVVDSQVKVGTPNIKGEKVKAKLLEQTKGDKVRVSKYKAKVRYRRTTGFRASLSKISIEQI